MFIVPPQMALSNECAEVSTTTKKKYKVNHLEHKQKRPVWPQREHTASEGAVWPKCCQNYKTVCPRVQRLSQEKISNAPQISWSSMYRSFGPSTACAPSSHVALLKPVVFLFSVHFF